MKRKLLLKSEKGVSLIEVMVGLLLLAAVCLSTLSYFAYGLGGIGLQGNRRAALERARERMEQLLVANTQTDFPAIDGTKYWCASGDLPNSCTSWPSANTAQLATVNDLQNMRMETTVQGVDDLSAGTNNFNDAWELGVKVWYTINTNFDDDHNRVYLKTLRAR